MSHEPDPWADDPDDPNIAPKGLVFIFGILLLTFGVAAAHRYLPPDNRIAGEIILVITGIILIRWSLR